MKRLLLLLFFVFNLLAAHAQYRPDSTRYQIQTKDGNTYIGVLVGQEEDRLLLETRNLGIIQIQKADIQKMETIEATDTKNGQVWVRHLQSVNYFNLPSSYNLKKGEVYYQNSWIFFSHLGVGVSDHVTIGGGFIPLFLFGSGNIPLWLTAKATVPIVKDKFSLGLNGVLVGITGSEGSGFVYGTGTLGSRDKNVTVGLGYAHMDGSWSPVPLVTLSAIIRTSAKSYFITENYYSAGTAWITLGGRRVFNPVSLDYGLFIPAGISETFVGIPWLGVVIPLRMKK